MRYQLGERATWTEEKPGPDSHLPVLPVCGNHYGEQWEAIWKRKPPGQRGLTARSLEHRNHLDEREPHGWDNYLKA